MTSGESSGSWITKTSTLVTAACTVAATLIGYFTLAAAVKWPPFQEGAPAQRQVKVYKAAGCDDGDNCAHIGVDLTGFAPGAEVICDYQSSVGGGGFTAEILRVDSEGHARKESDNRFWDPSGNGWVAVTCDSVRGVHENW